MARKPTRYTYLVTIEQKPWVCEKQPIFGPKGGWGQEVRKALQRQLFMANVIAVEPTRTRKVV